RPERRAEDDGHLDLAARHVVRLGGLIDHLIHRQRDEVAEHHVDDRTHARHRGADADAGVARLGDRRVDDPLGAELLDEPREGLERVAGLGHVFADEEHARVAPHHLRDRFLDRLSVRQLSLAHDRPPFICAPRSAGPQPRDGLQRALPRSPGRPWPQARLARSGRGVKWRRALNPSTRISAMATDGDARATAPKELGLDDAMAYARELQKEDRLEAADELYRR